MTSKSLKDFIFCLILETAGAGKAQEKEPTSIVPRAMENERQEPGGRSPDLLDQNSYYTLLRCSTYRTLLNPWIRFNFGFGRDGLFLLIFKTFTMASISSFEIQSKSDFAFFESLIAWSQFNKIYQLQSVKVCNERST